MVTLQTDPAVRASNASGVVSAQHAPLLQNHQAAGNGLHITDDMGTQNNDPVAGQAGEQGAKPHALGGVESGGRLIDDQEFGVVEQRLRDADALLHATGIGGQLAVGLPAPDSQSRAPHRRAA